MEVFGAKSALERCLKKQLHSIYSNISLKDHVSYLYRYQSFWHGLSILTINCIVSVVSILLYRIAQNYRMLFIDAKTFSTLRGNYGQQDQLWAARSIGEIARLHDYQTQEIHC